MTPNAASNLKPQKRSKTQEKGKDALFGKVKDRLKDLDGLIKKINSLNEKKEDDDDDLFKFK